MDNDVNVTAQKVNVTLLGIGVDICRLGMLYNDRSLQITPVIGVSTRGPEGVFSKNGRLLL